MHQTIQIARSHTLFIGSFSDRSVCKAANAAYPTTEQELISMISNATMGKRKIEVATRYGHNMAKLVCLDGRDGLLISTKILNRVLKIDFQAMKMPVESGATLRQVINGAIKDGVTVDKAGCALEGLCICPQDSHCATIEGYFCRPCKVFKDAGLCTRMST